MENRYHHRLQLPVAFVPLDLNIPIPSHVEYAVSNVNKDLVDMLASLGVSVIGAEVFSRPAGAYSGIHIDGGQPSDTTKINYVYGQGIMDWYKLKPGKELVQNFTTANSSIYLAAHHDDCEKVWSARVEETGSLVNVGGLHGVSNITTPRICYCLKLGDMANNNAKLQWDRAIELFKGYY
jgi:hypothetical protein